MKDMGDATTTTVKIADKPTTSIHRLGVICGLVAGVWLGAAEAPTKLVSIGLSPFAISLCMVAGVFAARWTFPTLLKGTSYVWADLMSKKHLIVWALLAGALWAVANTLTVFAIRDVGLSVAFPLWNANVLVGLFWARVLFRELEGAGGKVIFRVLLGTFAIVAAAIMLGFSSTHGGGGSQPARSMQGIVAALGACLMWGTMYVPYRKAYLSGMNPLSFVTAFTVGELATVGALAITLGGGAQQMRLELENAHAVLFWLFLGGFVWVIGDLFQQFAAKYLGIGRGIPLSNTNQLWGLAWAALVFHELAGADRQHKLLILAGSIAMIGGAALISSAVASGKEHSSRNEAILRECDRYGLDYSKTLSSMSGEEFGNAEQRRWWDYAIVVIATSIFVVLGLQARAPSLAMNKMYVGVLTLFLILSLIVGGISLWRTTRFS
jgi:drug/metabolite transporter (DMT)-like permease